MAILVHNKVKDQACAHLLQPYLQTGSIGRQWMCTLTNPLGSEKYLSCHFGPIGNQIERSSFSHVCNLMEPCDILPPAPKKRPRPKRPASEAAAVDQAEAAKDSKAAEETAMAAKVEEAKTKLVDLFKGLREKAEWWQWYQATSLRMARLWAYYDETSAHGRSGRRKKPKRRRSILQVDSASESAVRFDYFL